LGTTPKKADERKENTENNEDLFDEGKIKSLLYKKNIL
jgi:hypothetical protein